MAWSHRFTTELQQANPRPPVFIVEPMPMPSGGPSATMGIASHALTGYHDQLLGDSIEIVGQEVDTTTFKSTIGGWTFKLRAPIGQLLTSWVRGCMLQLRMGFSGWDPADFEVVALGQLRSIRGPGPEWHVEVWDLWAALQSRYTFTADQKGLFFAVDTSTTVATSAYTAGAATLDVASVSNFERETGGSYALRVTGDAGGTFYIKATGTSGAQFTGCSAAGEFETTTDAAAIGNKVEEVGLLSGHPRDILRRVFVSTGAGTNGTWDDYPAAWGYGIPSQYLDLADLAKVTGAIGSGVSWDLIAPQDGTTVGGAATAEQDNGWTWLQDRFSVGGCWPVVHEGGLSLRGVQDINATGVWDTGEVLTDDDVIEVLTHEIWADNHPAEYDAIGVNRIGGNSNKTEAVGTMPSVSHVLINGTVVGVADTLFIDSTAALDIRTRCGPWLLRVPERLVLMVRGLVWMRLVPGDLVTVDVTRTQVRRDNQGTRQLSNLAMVTQVSPQLLNSRVEIAVEFLPSWAGE